MIVLGLLLVVLAAGSGVWLVMGSRSMSTPVDLTAWGVTIGFTPLFLIVAGAAVLLVLWLGLALIRGSVRRRRRPARDAKAAQRQAEVEENIRADERSRSEEAHQAALVERDRVRDEEYQSRLAQHDEERDEEFRRRQADAEQRIRADEGARLERESTARDTAPDTAPDTARDTAPDTTQADSAAAGGTAPDSATPEASTESPQEADAVAGGRHHTVADEIMGRGGPAS